MGLIYAEGPDDFLNALDEFNLRDEPDVEMVTDWAHGLAGDNVARLRSTIGKKSRALRVQLRDEDVSLVTVWRNKQSVSLQLHGSVFLRRAPSAARQIDRRTAPQKTKKLNKRGSSYPPRPYSPELVAFLTSAYREAARS